MRESATMMIVKVTHELMRAHGGDPNNPHDMWELPWFARGIGVSGAPARRYAFENDVKIKKTVSQKVRGANRKNAN
jgi:hypothetical protein